MTTRKEVVAVLTLEHGYGLRSRITHEQRAERNPRRLVDEPRESIRRDSVP